MGFSIVTLKAVDGVVTLKTLYLERSTGEVRQGDWVEHLTLDGIKRIVVGMGPGSFAGVRAALAFAQGYAIGSGVEVLGLPSPCAIAATYGKAPLAVVGDARQGKFWLAKFPAGALAGEVELIADEPTLLARTMALTTVLSPDHRRIGERLAELFGDRYRGEALPTVEGLEAYALNYPEQLVREPLPIYLNPAVRN